MGSQHDSNLNSGAFEFKPSALALRLSHYPSFRAQLPKVLIDLLRYKAILKMLLPSNSENAPWLNFFSIYIRSFVNQLVCQSDEPIVMHGCIHSPGCGVEWVSSLLSPEAAARTILNMAAASLSLLTLMELARLVDGVVVVCSVCSAGGRFYK